MDFEYLIIAFIFLLAGITYVVYKFRYHTIKEDEEAGFSKYAGLSGAIIFIMLAVHLIWKEVEKII